MQFIKRGLWLVAFFLLGISACSLIASAVVIYLEPKTPAVAEIRKIDLQVPLRVYTEDGLLMGEFGEKRRQPISYANVPKLFIDAILAAEDDNFYNHSGVDLMGLARATLELIKTGKIRSGGSTITMQVAKNFYLSHERTFTRKFVEILLALQIEQELSKQEILELYVNKIYLGNRAYGIGAAAQVYYGKPIQHLDIAQLAMIAGLPKAPSKYNPLANATRATVRRDWILSRMYQLGRISRQQWEYARQIPVSASYHGSRLELHAPYAAEMVRREMVKKYGTKAYTRGFSVTTTLNSQLQKSGQASLIKGLKIYDNRHGYRGPLTTIDTTQPDFQPAKALASYDIKSTYHPAIVTTTSEEKVGIWIKEIGAFDLTLKQLQQERYRRFISENRRRPVVKTADQLLSVGDIIEVEYSENTWQLSQRPNVSGALVAVAPSNGAIKALVGGTDYSQSKFNRVTQAKRQPGSNFKPFFYGMALENGYTAASIFNDAPVVFKDKGLENTWRPDNSSGKFGGEMPLRQALYKSRNLVSIRLLRALGVNNVVDYTSRFGFNKSDMPRNLSLALGTLNVTPLELVTGYAVLANGGFSVQPYLISEISDLNKDLVFSAAPATACKICEEHARMLEQERDEEVIASSNAENVVLESTISDGQPALEEKTSLEQSLVSGIDSEKTTTDSSWMPTNQAKRIVDPRTIYILDSILQDVVKKGTARRALVLDRNDIAGKTGTTNGPTDAWFSGYNPDLVATAWVGFDQYQKLGKREFGGSAALPIWIDFMRTALKNSPDLPRARPQGLVSVAIDPQTGKLAAPGQSNAIFELFLKGTQPKQASSNGVNGSVILSPKNSTDITTESLF